MIYGLLRPMSLLRSCIEHLGEIDRGKAGEPSVPEKESISILYCIILYHMIFYYMIFCDFVLYDTILYHIPSKNQLSYYVILSAALALWGSRSVMECRTDPHFTALDVPSHVQL